MELTERLKAFGAKSEIYFGCDEDDEIWQDCGKYVLDNLPAIIAALQFAEDVKKLIAEAGPQAAVVFSGNGVKAGVLYKDGWFGEGPDIYTAARSAVAALAKGEG